MDFMVAAYSRFSIKKQPCTRGPVEGNDSPEADTLPELRKMIQDAVHYHFDENAMPRIIRLHIVQEEVMAA